jgi:hypothetical protein
LKPWQAGANLEHHQCRKQHSESLASQNLSIFSYSVTALAFLSSVVPGHFCDPILGLSRNCDTLLWHFLPRDGTYLLIDAPAKLSPSLPDCCASLRVSQKPSEHQQQDYHNSIFRTHFYGFCIIVISFIGIYLGTVHISLFLEGLCFPLCFFTSRSSYGWWPPFPHHTSWQLAIYQQGPEGLAGGKEKSRGSLYSLFSNIPYFQIGKRPAWIKKLVRF